MFPLSFYVITYYSKVLDLLSHLPYEGFDKPNPLTLHFLCTDDPDRTLDNEFLSTERRAI